MKIPIILLGMVLLITACSNAPTEDTTTEPEMYVIGAIMPLSGDAAAYGDPLQRTAELAAREINDAGGIDGKIALEGKDIIKHKKIQEVYLGGRY